MSVFFSTERKFKRGRSGACGKFFHAHSWTWERLGPCHKLPQPFLDDNYDNISHNFSSLWNYNHGSFIYLEAGMAGRIGACTSRSEGSWKQAIFLGGKIDFLFLFFLMKFIWDNRLLSCRSSCTSHYWYVWFHCFRLKCKKWELKWLPWRGMLSITHVR